MKLLLLLVFFACAQINPQEREQFWHSKQVRHGIVSTGDAEITHIPEALNQVSIDRGKELYRQDCLACHGVEGRGDGPLPERAG